MIARNRLSVGLAASIAAAAIAGCGGGGTSTSSNATTSTSGCATQLPPKANVNRTFDAPPANEIDAAKTYTASIATTCGDIAVSLDVKAAPKTANNFIALARKRYFDGLTFHRVIKGFVIQGGDPEGTGRGGPGYTFADELPTTPYQIGDLVMANSGPDTNGSQFFIITGPDGAALSPDYARFGHVTSGIDVAQKIADLQTAGKDAPSIPVGMATVTITER